MPDEPLLLQLESIPPEAIRAELAAGLQAPQAWVAPKFLYDGLGSRLFDAITQLPEYYPTRTEALLMRDHAADIAARLPHHATLVDLGAGDGVKASRLFAALATPRYVAVDISTDFLAEALTRLQRLHPEVQMLGVGQDFSHQLNLPLEVGPADQPRVLFYPGSSIGNFDPAAALGFLRQVHAACGTHGESGLLIGVDLVKPVDVLEPAYDDALGVTAAFNRNLLLNVNRWLQADFSPADWQHVAFFNPLDSRIEMHLQALRPVTVTWSGGRRWFQAGERIHTENSYKWTASGFSTLLVQAGFQSPTVWTDPAQWFGVFWAPAHPVS